jgi:hypothetical protein
LAVIPESYGGSGKYGRSTDRAGPLRHQEENSTAVRGRTAVSTVLVETRHKFLRSLSCVVLENGEGRIRTSEGVCRQIYSLLPLATRALLQSCPPGPAEVECDDTKTPPFQSNAKCRKSFPTKPSDSDADLEPSVPRRSGSLTLLIASGIPLDKSLALVYQFRRKSLS